ncbi:MAG: peptidylprolyl isomerase [Desulfovibrio sp.]|nr:peptidylprolyl isomerase [Desulfovibrio sp.]
MPIKNGDKVKVHYTGSLAEDGKEFDSSRDREPLEFIMGRGMLIPGFENALLGKEAGDKIRVEIPVEEAYGAIDPEKIFAVSKAQVPSHIPLEPGTRLELTSEKGSMPVIISEVGPDEITLDANHELAGKDLVFDIEVVDVKPGDENK